MRTLRSIVIATAALALVAWGSVPEDEAPRLQVEPATVAAGESIAFSGRVAPSGDLACPSADAVVLTSDADLFPPDGRGPEVARDALGDFAVEFTLADATRAGEYVVGLRCGGGNVGVEAVLVVTDDDGDAGSLVGWGIAAAALAVAGVVAFGVMLARAGRLGLSGRSGVH